MLVCNWNISEQLACKLLLFTKEAIVHILFFYLLMPFGESNQNRNNIIVKILHAEGTVLLGEILYL